MNLSILATDKNAIGGEKIVRQEWGPHGYPLRKHSSHLIPHYVSSGGVYVLMLQLFLINHQAIIVFPAQVRILTDWPEAWLIAQIAHPIFPNSH